ncbi:MAG: IS4 family transposase [Bacteroidales bacterium]|nr:IS4 family transposase [Bacteroidales bacterium]
MEWYANLGDRWHPTVAAKSSIYKDEFGEHQFGPNANSPRSMAMGSLLYDVFNHLTLDAQLAPYAHSERDLLMQHLNRVKKGDILLLDRGYPSFWLLFLLKAKGIEFCVRLKDNWWLKVKDFTESNEQERLVTFTLPKKDYKKLAEYPDMQEATITCRLIKIVLPDGTIEVLCTSLVDSEKYSFEEMKELYHYRWNVEEAYKLLKSRIEIEDFSGKTARAVRQDFHAKVLLMTLCAAYAFPIEQKVIAEYKADETRKYAQKINRTNALSTTMEILVETFIKNNIVRALSAFDQIVENTREIIRPNRKVPRNHRQKKPYSMNYKQL